MKKSKFTETQIVSILKEADAGLEVADVCRKHGISQPTYYHWKSKYLRPQFIRWASKSGRAGIHQGP
jgi:transposase-like protein